MVFVCLIFLYVGGCICKPQGHFFTSGLVDPIFNSPANMLENMMESPIKMPSMSMFEAPELGIDPKKVKTRKKTEKKGNVTITETNKTGPNFYMQEVEVNGGGGGLKGMAEMKQFGQFSPFLVRGEPWPFTLKNKDNCKNCNSTQFCLAGQCVNKRPEGATCMNNDECKKSLFCVFGVCNKAEKGDAGTQCKRHDECGDELCCFPSRFRKECSARLPLGAVCSTSPFASGFRDILPMPFRKRRSLKSCNNPCQDDLKCAANGDGMEKKCVQSDFKFSAVDDIVSGDDDKDSESDDDDSNIKVATGEGDEIPDSSEKKKASKKKQKKKNKKASNKSKDNQ